MSDSSGSFGSNANRGTRTRRKPEDVKPERIHKERRPVSELLGRISPENWIDIVCCTLLGVFFIAVAVHWSEFSEALFRSVLFPIIYVGSRIVAFVTGAAAVIGGLVLWLRSRRRRRWFL